MRVGAVVVMALISVVQCESGTCEMLEQQMKHEENKENSIESSLNSTPLKKETIDYIRNQEGATMRIAFLFHFFFSDNLINENCEDHEVNCITIND